MNKGKDIPVHRQLIDVLSAGFGALDEETQAEIKDFISGQQNKNGGFYDRAGTPDLYYSLFGLWLSMAAKQKEQQSLLKQYIQSIDSSRATSAVEEMALLLIRFDLESNSDKYSVLSVYRRVLKHGGLLDLSYQFFLLSLLIDAVGKRKRGYYFLARLWLLFYSPKGNLPCSVVAALLFARQFLDLKTNKQKKQIEKYSLDSGGFMAFTGMENADMLSTGVALFALNKTNYDLRFIAPGGMQFIQDNYREGAFLSGDGDQTKDLEYTFYGLLALGSLVDDNS